MVRTTLILLPLLLATVSSRPHLRINPCLYNREDVLPCTDHHRRGVLSPGANQYIVHATRFQRGASGLPICVKRKEGELLKDIEDLGSSSMKFLFSPGAERSPTVNYVNQMVAEYNVQCNPGTTAFLQFEEFSLEPKTCDSDRGMKCRDYLLIETSDSGTTELCGSNAPSEPLFVGTGSFTLKLRTSFSMNYPGFRIFVTCFNENEAIDQNNCTTPGGSRKKRSPDHEARMIDTLQDYIDRYDHPPEDEPPNTSTNRRLSLTTAEKRTINDLAESLFSEALRSARLNIQSWPPASYSRNDPDDILDLSDLELPTLEGPSSLQQEQRDLPPAIPWKRSTTQHEDTTSLLRSEATLNAVRYETACNPILRSVTRSYLSIAQRLVPVSLERARVQYRQEMSLVQP